MPDTPAHRSITGSCHCRNIRFTFDVPATLSPIPVRACGCTFCVKHRGIWTSHPQGRFYKVDRSELVEATMNFAAETIASRFARRARNWTPEATTVSTV